MTKQQVAHIARTHGVSVAVTHIMRFGFTLNQAAHYCFKAMRATR